MKQIEVVAAVICHNGKFFATHAVMANSKTFGSSPEEKWNPVKHVKKL